METKVENLESLSGFARDWLSRHPRGTIVGLSGDLGAGKTTFVRAVIAELSQRAGESAPRVVSPSFVVHLAYARLARSVDHFDLYRLSNVDEAALTELGYFEVIDECRRRAGLVFVEWPEHVTSDAILSLDSRLEIKIVGETRLFSES